MRLPPGVAVLAVLGVPVVLHAGAPPDRLQDVLRRTAAWVEHFADEAAYIVADERYVQETATVAGATAERRELRSEIALVRTEAEEAHDGFPWVQFRDVIEVDGKSLSDREGRLAELFRHPSASSYRQAARLIEESARYNIGPIPRTVNVPAFVLLLLTSRSQPRFRFAQVADAAAEAGGATAVSFQERSRPTIVRSAEGRDRPVKGRVWIDAATGQVQRTRLDADAAQGWTVAIEVEFGRDTPTGLWVPQVMRETYAGPGGARMDGVARYTNYRRFATDARMVR